MTTHRTVCPHCHYQFNISDEQLGLKDGLARCSQCQQVFSAKQNLLPQIPSDERFLPNSNQPPVVSAQSLTADTISQAPSMTRSLNQKKQFNPNEAIIFDDSMELAEEKTTFNPSEDFSLDILEDFDKLPTPHTIAPAFKDTTNTTPTSPNEEAWLEQLLNEEKEKERNASHFDSKKISTIPANATDVASLLDEFGVEVAPLKQLSEDETHLKIEQRLSHQPTPQKIAKKERHSLFPTLLWSLGSGLLLLGLIAQYVAYNRDDIIKNPTQASTLRAFCSGLSLPCNLANADLNAIAVQVNKLEANGDKTDATLTLTNQSHVTQLYPTLKLTLLANNTDVGQLIASPKQYLDTSNLHMSAEQIKPLKLRIELPRAKFDKIAIEKLY